MRRRGSLLTSQTSSGSRCRPRTVTSMRRCAVSRTAWPKAGERRSRTANASLPTTSDLGVDQGRGRARPRHVLDERHLAEEVGAVQARHVTRAQGAICLLADRDLARDDEEHRVALVALGEDPAAGLEELERRGLNQPADERLADVREQRRAPQEADELVLPGAPREANGEPALEPLGPFEDVREILGAPRADLGRRRRPVHGDLGFAGELRAPEHRARPLLADDLRDAVGVGRRPRTDLAGDDEVEARQAVGLEHLAGNERAAGVGPPRPRQLSGHVTLAAGAGTARRA